MIEINLVPLHLRKKKKSASMAAPTALKRETWFLAVGLFLLVMMAVIVVLQVLIFRQSARQTSYEKEMTGFMSQKIEVDRVIEQIKQTKIKLASLEKIVGPKEVIWSQKLNEISDLLPRGLWLNRLSLQDGNLLVNGSALTVNQGDMSNVHNYTAALKKDVVFAQDFQSVEIELIKSRDIAGTSVADFTIRAELKNRGKK